MRRIFGIVISVLIPGIGWACGCGCSIFDVRTSSMLPISEGGVVFLEYSHVNQNRNWSASSEAPAADNGDKQIRTEFYTFGVQYMINREWGMILQIPYENRYFRTEESIGDVMRVRHDGLGDVRIKGIYTGFSPDMSSGLILGLKLPTGDYTNPGFDRDTQIGTGSTDILLGGFLRGTFPIGNRWNWFLTGQLDQPFLSKNEYCPGAEVNGVAGAYYSGWAIGHIKIAPVVQIIESYHWRDSGSDAHASDSGYDRALLAPGVEIDIRRFSLYADVAFPVYQHVNGNQLMAPELFTLRMSYNF